MRFRKLRIAWSVAWALLVALLCVLWVRSHWRYQRIYFQVSSGELSHTFVFRSYGNRLRTQYLNERINKGSQARWFEYDTEDSPAEAWFEIERMNPPPYTLGFRHQWVNGGIDTVVPHWFEMCACVALAAVPWLRFRFSLRTMLIATTLIAVVLGLIVRMSRAG